MKVQVSQVGAEQSLQRRTAGTSAWLVHLMSSGSGPAAGFAMYAGRFAFAATMHVPQKNFPSAANRQVWHIGTAQA